MSKPIVPYLLVFGLTVAIGTAQEASITQAADKMAARVEQSQLELKNTYKRIDLDLLPLKQQLEALELEVETVRDEYLKVQRLKDTRTLDISNLKAQITSKTERSEFLANSLDDYFRNFEARLHIGELQKRGEEIERLKGEAANTNNNPQQRLAARIDLAKLSLDRIESAVGGQLFPGRAVDADGVVGDGTFLLLGPLAYFAGADAQHTGLARSALNSNEPTVTPLPGDPELGASINAVAEKGSGSLPVDTTGGDAIKVAEATDSVLDQIKKGGAVMYPLLGLGGISVLIGLVKWLQLSRVKRIGAKRFHQFMAFLVNGQADKACAEAERVKGPLGGLLSAAAENADEPRELMEELMYEKVLHARGRLNSFLPFIKVTAAAAPLLGLLGTVSGMINTFKMITIYGTGDAQTFSGGISEALITTQWGLIVAIPCLLLAAFLSRKAKAVTDDMEKLGVAIMNGLPQRRGDDDEGEGDDDGDPGPPVSPRPAPKPALKKTERIPLADLPEAPPEPA